MSRPQTQLAMLTLPQIPIWDKFTNFETFKCDCYPSYDSNFHASGVKASYIDNDDKMLLTFLNIGDRFDHVTNIIVAVKPCNFYEHANCVASFINKDGFENDTECLPSCDHTSIHQESIQYTRMDTALTDYFRTVAAKSITSTKDMNFLALGEFSP